MAMDEIRFFRFVEWLTRRYDRPTVTDELYEAFHRPVYRALNELLENDAEILRTFSRAIHDIRASITSETRPPCELGIVYLTALGVSEQELDAIENIHTVIAGAVADSVIVLDPVLLPLDEVQHMAMLRTQPLTLDDVSADDSESAPSLWMLERGSR
jgi:hypothetical protein